MIKFDQVCCLLFWICIVHSHSFLRMLLCGYEDTREILLRHSYKCPFHLFVVKFQTGHWSYFFSENVVRLQQSFKKMMQFYIYCAVPGPKWSQLNKFHMYFSSVKSHIVPFGNFLPSWRMNRRGYIYCLLSLRFHYLYVKSCV